MVCFEKITLIFWVMALLGVGGCDVTKTGGMAAAILDFTQKIEIYRNSVEIENLPYILDM